MTVPEDLRHLVEVQDLDTALDQHDHRRSTLAERSELAALHRDTERMAVQNRDANSRRDEVAGRQGVLEAELATVEARVREVNRRLYSGEVSASRELQAMAADVQSSEARASELEDRILAVLDEREPLDATVDALDQELAASAATEAAILARLSAAESVIDAEIDDLKARRQVKAASVPAEILATYERLRRQLGGVGAARLVSGRCGGCHLTLPATELDRLRHGQSGEIPYCDQCGRILVLG